MKTYCSHHSKLPFESHWTTFIKKEEYEHLFREYILHPTTFKKALLQSKFYQFVQEQRLVAYMSKSIHYTAVNFDKKARLFSERNQVWLDQPMEEGGTPKDLLSSDEESNGLSLESHLSSQNLYKAWMALTSKQQDVLSLSFVYGYTDGEIGHIFEQSQQSISRIKNRAFVQLRRYYDE
ncbi:DNA-directed RNA polymerase specialized sigma24 family protein [Salibacterium salarium]|uniref:RNA polymerase sigma factor n=1 Tax=Salibacterium salarium TaxID=284579 RepID=UPI00277DEDC0|nr:sigma factor-like helix-turn-helix DNA-binding protein [Salibacterium salarium]MDQ0297729.1 DNA-directed RNA polymerase specialized sigma24 family protein [Salibacterium salarium]